MLTRGEGTVVEDLGDAVERGYTAAKPLTDEFVMPLLRKGSNGGPRAVIKDGDACFFYNFRADRARQLTLAFHAPTHEARVVAKPGEDFIVLQHQMPAVVNGPIAFGLLERIQSRFCAPAQRERFRGVALLDEESPLSAQLQNRFQMIQHLVRAGFIACCSQRAAVVREIKASERRPRTLDGNRSG